MENLLLVAIRAAILAGSEIMRIYSGRDIEVTLKQDYSPLTLADENANNIINSCLEPTEIPIISEENKQVSFSRRKHWETCWMVDPLDGTKEFVNRNGEFTVNIALIKHHKPILGVIYVPGLNTLYFATVEENRAYKIHISGQEKLDDLLQKKIEIKPKNKEESKFRIVGSRSHKSRDTDMFIEKLKLEGKEVELVSRGSSLKFCLLAEGEADLYPRFAPTMEWDTAAGHAICNAVGIRVVQKDSNIELQYNKEDLLNPHFMVEGYGAC